MVDVAQLKAQIRAILLALGRGATERDFRKEFYEMEGQSFNEVLKKLGFHSSRSFFAEIPDVCRTSYTADNELFFKRISNEQTSHMDRLTIAKKRKRPKRFMPVQRYPRTPYQYSAPQRYQQMPLRAPRLATNYYQPQMRPSFGPAGCNNNSRPINNQRVPFPPANRPPTVPQRVQARPTLPIRSTLGSERVVYKKNECIVYDGNNEKAVSVIRPSPPPVAQTVQVKPSLPTVPIHSRLGSERVVYNKSDVAQLKAKIRALLLALGREATERDFRKEFYKMEGQSFNEVLKKLGFHSSRSFFVEIPDVCRTSYTADNELFIRRISNEQTSHLDRLTVAKKRNRSKRFMPVQRYPRM